MNLEELHKLKERAQRHIAPGGANKKYRVVFSMGTSSIAAGARDVMTTVFDELDSRGIDHVEVAATSDLGLANAEPVVRVEDQSGEKVTYAKVSPAARKIVAERLADGKVVEGLTVGRIKRPGQGKSPTPD